MPDHPRQARTGVGHDNINARNAKKFQVFMKMSVFDI
jgi:hypothetical protein